MWFCLIQTVASVSHASSGMLVRPPMILELLSFCLNTTYFTYRGVIHKQKHGAATGSPLSAIIANPYIFMEGFEEIAFYKAADSLYTVMLLLCSVANLVITY